VVLKQALYPELDLAITSLKVDSITWAQYLHQSKLKSIHPYKILCANSEISNFELLSYEKKVLRCLSASGKGFFSKKTPEPKKI